MQYFDVLFYLFAALAVASALIVVFSRNVVYAAFSLMFTFLGVAGLYVLLMADFLAIAQIMVYVGGILVLIIFGVMLTNRITNVEIVESNFRSIPATIVVGVFLGTIALVMSRTDWLVSGVVPETSGTTLEIGEYLMTSYLLPFEIAGIVLLVAIMGAAMIARQKREGEGV